MARAGRATRSHAVPLGPLPVVRRVVTPPRSVPQKQAPTVAISSDDDGPTAGTVRPARGEQVRSGRSTAGVSRHRAALVTSRGGAGRQPASSRAVAEVGRTGEEAVAWCGDGACRAHLARSPPPARWRERSRSGGQEAGPTRHERPHTATGYIRGDSSAAAVPADSTTPDLTPAPLEAGVSRDWGRDWGDWTETGETGVRP
jgi:hypothetical protein